MVEKFEAFHLFQDEAIALEFAQLLNNAGIQCIIASNPRMLDHQFVGVDSAPDYALKVRPEDFSAANTILNSFFEKQIDSVDKEYFIFSFTNEELNDVLKKPDEWGYLNFQLAKKILGEREQSVSIETLEKMKAERKITLSATESPGLFLYIVAYFLIISGLLFIISRNLRPEGFLTVFLSIFSFLIGRHINRHKKIMPDGQFVYGYHEKDRAQGKFITLLAFVVVLLSSVKFLWLLLGEA